MAHPDVDRISFTGSTETARLIGQSAAKSITPVSFELGGKSPFIVMRDADLGAAAQTVAGSISTRVRYAWPELACSWKSRLRKNFSPG